MKKILFVALLLIFKNNFTMKEFNQTSLSSKEKKTCDFEEFKKTLNLLAVNLQYSNGYYCGISKIIKYCHEKYPKEKIKYWYKMECPFQGKQTRHRNLSSLYKKIVLPIVQQALDKKIHKDTRSINGWQNYFCIVCNKMNQKDEKIIKLFEEKPKLFDPKNLKLFMEEKKLLIEKQEK